MQSKHATVLLERCMLGYVCFAHFPLRDVAVVHVCIMFGCEINSLICKWLRAFTADDIYRIGIILNKQGQFSTQFAQIHQTN